MQFIPLLILQTTTAQLANEYNDWKVIKNCILSKLLRVFVQIIAYYTTCIKVVDNLNQRLPTGGPRLDLLRPPPSHRFGSIGESFNICLILLVQRKI
jgi:hypothetical protein